MNDPAGGGAAHEVLDFWFRDAFDGIDALSRRSKQWFATDPDFDREIAARFGNVLEQAATGALAPWRDAPQQRLALTIVLDQFPRNLHRGSAAAFLHDAHALEVCQEGITLGHDRSLRLAERVFLYMPLQHAEDPIVQAQSVERFELLAHEASAEEKAYYEHSASFAREHRDIIERFGRFPHRNRVLGRESTPEEKEYLAAGAPSFGQ